MLSLINIHKPRHPLPSNMITFRHFVLAVRSVSHSVDSWCECVASTSRHDFRIRILFGRDEFAHGSGGEEAVGLDHPGLEGCAGNHLFEAFVEIGTSFHVRGEFGLAKEEHETYETGEVASAAVGRAGIGSLEEDQFRIIGTVVGLVEVFSSP